jgi:uncharacterized protein
MIAILAGATLSGLVGSPHCVAMCGGFAVAAGDRPAHSLAWSAGRLVTYGALGAIAGAVGGHIPGPGWVGTVVATAFLVLFAGKLAGLPWLQLPVIPGLQQLGGRLLGRGDLPSRFLFGGVTGLLPCGLVYAALALPLASSDPLMGALTMLAFGVGTLPALSFAAVGLRAVVATSPMRRRALALAVLVMGLFALHMRSPTTAQADGGEPGPPACHDAAATSAAPVTGPTTASP